MLMLADEVHSCTQYTVVLNSVRVRILAVQASLLKLVCSVIRGRMVAMLPSSCIDQCCSRRVKRCGM
jgi:hypothetical protein